MPRRFHGRDIRFKELYAVLYAILCWADQWSQGQVVLLCDNRAVVAWLNLGTSRSQQAMPILCMNFMLSSFYQFTFTSSWLCYADNACADAASCFQYRHLLNLQPSINPKPLLSNPQINGTRRTLAIPAWLHSSFGMALPQAHTAPTPQDSGFSLTSFASTQHLHKKAATSSPPHQPQSSSGWSALQAMSNPRP